MADTNELAGNGDRVGWRVGPADGTPGDAGEAVSEVLTAGQVLEVGEPLAVTECAGPRAQPVVAFVLARDLAGTSVTATHVLAATAGVAVGIEVRASVDRLPATEVGADEPSARFVTGSPVPVAGLDLRLVGVVLELNGEVLATASGAAALGHPAAAVALLVRTLAADGAGLRAGDVVLSGGLTPGVPVGPRDTVLVAIDRLGSVELACR